MAGTTFKLIRQRQLEVLRQLELELLPASPLRHWEPKPSDMDFAEWADAAAGGAFRVFEIEHGLDYSDEKYLDNFTENVVHSQVVLVAYPQTRELEGQRLDDIIDQDITDITVALGMRGYQNYSTLGEGVHACQRSGTTIDDQDASRVLSIKFQLDYDRRIP
jgi:hypothetical protein